MFIGTALMAGALLWARDIHRRARREGVPANYRGPWLLGAVGASVFTLYLLLVTGTLAP